MASTSSQEFSPHSNPVDFDPFGDTDDSWQYLDFGYSSGSSEPASVGFLPSPASGSLQGYAIVGRLSNSAPSQTSGSPSHIPSNGDEAPGMSEIILPMSMPEASSSNAFSASEGASSWTQNMPFLTPQAFLFPGMEDTELTSQGHNYLNQPLFELPADTLPALGPSVHEYPEATIAVKEQMQEASQADCLQQFPGDMQWHTELSVENGDIRSSSGATTYTPPGTSTSSSPELKSVKSEKYSTSPARPRKVAADKVDKKMKKTSQAGNFVVVTPISISAHQGRPNPYECFEQMRATHKGRKGPLASASKKNALQVRRLGACFCCHSRKVKCDKERPCRNCNKLASSVPQVVCWQFQDFLTVLFPDFLRTHLRKDEVVKFLSANVDDFKVGGEVLPCEVELYSGPAFGSTLTVKANFFTARTLDVLQHWHVMGGSDRLDLQSNGSAPLGADMSADGAKEDLRKRTKAYIQDIIKEPDFAAQVTDSMRSTSLPRLVLDVVQRYAEQVDSTIVKRALSIYAMHYVITRHLCITQKSVFALQPTGLIPQDTLWVTPRVLARQIKAIVDDHMQREMQHLFDMFSKSLKPKCRSEWAPCLAAFLVLCLFIEAVETATDGFVVMENEVNLRHGDPPKYKRSFALDMCKQLENLPFKQFAYQFHNIYQTHSKDANAKGFNPLFDDSFAEQGELEGPAVELVTGLKELYYGETWQDMQFLSDDNLVISREEHPFPRDPSLVYTGRLLAKFLLSFTDENAIFGSRV